jgi:hypothetical protein
MYRTPALLASAGLVLAGAVVSIPAAQAHETGIHDNCTNFNQRWEHGVGRRGAVDQTSGDRVTTFLRSNRKYRRAVNHNPDLDRDGDKIACENA